MKKTINRIVSSLICTTLLSGMLTFTVFADTTHDKLNLYSDGAVVPIENFYNQNTNDGKTKIAASTTSIEQTIYNGLNSFQEKINVEQYNVSPSDFKIILENVLNSCPEFFYVEAGFSYEKSDEHVTSFTPSYTSTPAEMTSQKTFLKNEMDKIIAQVDSSWSDVEKIVFIHDYLAQNFEYDTSFKTYDAYNFFKSGKGVCQAYTATFAGLMKELGIDVTTASSESMKHIWNLVKVNGKWYHVDVTWDDPTTDKFSLVSHKNLLLSDSQASSTRSTSKYHYSWVTSYNCTDTTYDNYFWYTDDISSPFKYLDGKWYYAKFETDLKTGNIYSCDLKNQGKTVASTGKWNNYENSNAYYTNTFCGLDVYDNKLYFNTQDSLCYYNPSDNTVKTIITPDVAGRISGLRIRNNQIQYSVTTDFANYKTYTCLLTTTSPSTNTTVISLGDVDLNGKVNLSDAKALLKEALGIKRLSDEAKKYADLDFNNKINLNDAKLLLKLSLGIIKADSLQKK